MKEDDVAGTGELATQRCLYHISGGDVSGLPEFASAVPFLDLAVPANNGAVIDRVTKHKH